ncbi:MAG: PTS system mannose-specific IIA component [Francisellaceae bacterium]|jgi:PTS system mannose-specific IIA component
MVDIILVSHGSIASSIYEVALEIMPDYAGQVFIIDDINVAGSDYFEHSLLAIMKNFNDEVLIMTDICGATPDNTVKRVLSGFDVMIVSGLSLPMLLKVFNYGDKPLSELVVLACEGAINAVSVCYGGNI